MKKTIKTDIREKIATRAYFAWLAGSTAGADADWLAAEAIELAYAERRAATAAKAAATRRAKGFYEKVVKTPATAAAKRKPSAARATAH